MIAIQNYNKLLPARDAKTHKRSDVYLKKAVYNTAADRVMQWDVKPSKDMLYPRNMTSKFIYSTALHNIKAINYPPLVLSNFAFIIFKQKSINMYLLRMASKSEKVFSMKHDLLSLEATWFNNNT